METHSSILAWKKSPGQRSLAGYSPWGPKKSDMTHRLNYINSVPVSTQSPNLPLPFPPGSHKFAFYICDSISVL